MSHRHTKSHQRHPSPAVLSKRRKASTRAIQVITAVTKPQPLSRRRVVKKPVQKEQTDAQKTFVDFLLRSQGEKSVNDLIHISQSRNSITVKDKVGFTSTILPQLSDRQAIPEETYAAFAKTMRELGFKHLRHNEKQERFVARVSSNNPFRAALMAPPSDLEPKPQEQMSPKQSPSTFSQMQANHGSDEEDSLSTKDEVAPFCQTHEDLEIFQKEIRETQAQQATILQNLTQAVESLKETNRSIQEAQRQLAQSIRHDQRKLNTLIQVACEVALSINKQTDLPQLTDKYNKVTNDLISSSFLPGDPKKLLDFKKVNSQMPPVSKPLVSKVAKPIFGIIPMQAQSKETLKVGEAPQKTFETPKQSPGSKPAIDLTFLKGDDEYSLQEAVCQSWSSACNEAKSESWNIPLGKTILRPDDRADEQSEYLSIIENFEQRQDTSCKEDIVSFMRDKEVDDSVIGNRCNTILRLKDTPPEPQPSHFRKLRTEIRPVEGFGDFSQSSISDTPSLHKNKSVSQDVDRTPPNHTQVQAHFKFNDEDEEVIQEARPTIGVSVTPLLNQGVCQLERDAK